MTLAAASHDSVLTQVDRRPAGDSSGRRVLFVDSSPEAFVGLQEQMSDAGPPWQVDYAASGEQALAVLAAEPVDVIIVDEQLAPMDGVTLLTRVREKHPTTIRMILSQSSAANRPSLAAIVAHRVLAKPCNVSELALMVRRSCALRTLTGETEAYRRTMAAAALPSKPGVYMELNRVLSDPTWQPSQVSAAVERDVAMSAKVLQLANSALFGLTQNVTAVKDAVVYLGVETVKSLALTAEAFGKLGPRNTTDFSFDAFQNHAMLVARITAAMLPTGRAQQEAVTAALLHDIGKLVIISDGSTRWSQLKRQAAAREIPVHELEQENDGVTHADIGAYLLSLWGLPDAIVEAVAHHHTAGRVPGVALDSVVAVHVANALAHELEPAADDAPPHTGLDEELIGRLGLESRVELWRNAARQLADAARAPEARRR